MHFILQNKLADPENGVELNNINNSDTNIPQQNGSATVPQPTPALSTSNTSEKALPDVA